MAQGLIMNYSSDADKLHSMVLLLKMRAKSTGELTAIWTENDHSVWKTDEIEAARVVLLERVGRVPEQKRQAEEKSAARAEKPDEDDWFWDPFSEKGWQIRKAGFIIGGAVLAVDILLLLLTLLWNLVSR